jgi:hypothetical protein
MASNTSQAQGKHPVSVDDDSDVDDLDGADAVLNSRDDPHMARIPLSDRCTRCLWKTAPRKTLTPNDHDKFETTDSPRRLTGTSTCRDRWAIEKFG